LSLFVEDKNQKKNIMKTLAAIILSYEGYTLDKITSERIQKCIDSHKKNGINMVERFNRIQTIKNYKN
tara:strand:- start:886 stop:1089 length:204 start_codon:yes stop_codon:yes gene_type:complete